MNRQRVVTILTAVIVAMWIVSAVVRLFIAWPEAAILDSAMAPLVGFWFLSNARKNGNGKEAPAI